MTSEKWLICGMTSDFRPICGIGPFVGIGLVVGPSLVVSLTYMSLVMRKPDFCICENKDADQFRDSREVDQRLCFRYTDSTIPLLPKYEITSHEPCSVTVQPGLCGTWSETPKTGFLTTRLIAFS